MAKLAQTPVQVNGVNHMVETDAKSGKTVVYIDGQFALEHKNNSLSWAIGVNEDIPVMIDNMQFIVAVRKGRVRLAANGLFIDNNQGFEPAQQAPGWLLVFIILCLVEAAISIILVGGLLGVLIGILGMAVCGMVGRSKLANGAKIVLCILSVVAVFAVWYLLSAAVLAIL